MATEADEQSLSHLERQAEHTRANLIHTVDELHNRVSPQAIKQEMRAYARDASQDLLHNLERRARENPLQTVAVAAGPGVALCREYPRSYPSDRSRPRPQSGRGAFSPEG